MPAPITLLVHGAESAGDVPGIEALPPDTEVRYATHADALAAALPGAQVLLGWNFRANELADAWDRADALRWIHWAGAGVDAVLFPALVASAVTLTNARGQFDRPMAEYVLGLVIAMAKGFPETFAAQAERRWHYRLTERIEGRRALVVGVGSIGRAIGRTLRAAGLEVSGLGRSARAGDPDFRDVYGPGDLHRALAGADYVVSILPRTADTEGLFGAEAFSAMQPTARFINLGRGASVDEAALVAALESGAIAGAALDVFETEPLPGSSPLWGAPNLIVSPHMSGDSHDYKVGVFEQFLDNFRRYAAGQPLCNVVDKARGY